MSDPKLAQATPAAPAAPAAPAPVTAPAQSASASPAPQPNPTPAASPAAAPASTSQVSPQAPAAAAPPTPPESAAAPTPAPAKAPSTILGDALEQKPAEAQPADATKPPTESADKAAEAEKPKDAAQTADPAPLPSYEAFKLPEGITLTPESAAEFSKSLGEFETKTKADHAEVQAFGQRLLDTHIARVQAEIQAYDQHFAQQFEESRQEQSAKWRADFLADPEIGGNGHQTTVDNAIRMIRRYGGTPEQQKGLQDLLGASGYGNHPLLIGLLGRAGAALTREGRQIAAVSVPSAEKVSKLDVMYGGKSRGKAA